MSIYDCSIEANSEKEQKMSILDQIKNKTIFIINCNNTLSFVVPLFNRQIISI
jgi:hypothetical protein